MSETVVTTTTTQQVPRDNDVRVVYAKRDGQNFVGAGEVQVFRPSLDDMRDFTSYLLRLEREHGAHLTCGICKVIPPSEWRPRSRLVDYPDIDSLTIYSPVKERIVQVPGRPGVFNKINKVYRREISCREFRQLSEKFRVVKDSVEDLEKFYWENATEGQPIYGADTPGTLYDDDVDVFNVTRLGTVMESLLDEQGIKIKGVNTPYLYVGMYKTTFPWHAEDMDLYSINYMHVGEPKFWYGIPPEAADRFERLAAQLFPDASSACKGFLRHKTHIIGPDVLRRHGIPFGSMVQYPGEFIITFPRGYHQGFNCGFNIAEATNFALDRWIDIGKNCVLCTCPGQNDRVEIDMTLFMRRYRPAEFDIWQRYWYTRRPFADRAQIKQGITRQKLSRLFPGMPEREAFVAVITSEQCHRAEDAHRHWARLFQSKPCFRDEQDFNRYQARAFPHCAVCQYGVPDLDLTQDLSLPFQFPQKSRRYMTNQMFHKNRFSTAPDPEQDSLLTCASCKVTVHRHCYVLLPTEDGSGLVDYASTSSDTPSASWKCYRCNGRDRELIEMTTCRFCPMRAGAMIPAVSGRFNDEQFAHVICALSSRRTKIVSRPGSTTPVAVSLPSLAGLPWRDAPSQTEALVNPFRIRLDPAYIGVRVSPISTARHMQCEVCCTNGEDMPACDLCDEISMGRHFHATCGRFLGIVSERRDFPVVLAPVCSVHSDEPPSCFVEEEVIEPGDDVIVEGLVASTLTGTVEAVSFSDELRVDFLDGSISCNVRPFDIVGCECNELLCDRVNHVFGSLCTVSWADGLTYPAYYRGKQRKGIYRVHLDSPLEPSPDASFETVEVPRSQIAKNTAHHPHRRKRKAQDEAIPRKKR